MNKYYDISIYLRSCHGDGHREAPIVFREVSEKEVNALYTSLTDQEAVLIRSDSKVIEAFPYHNIIRVTIKER